MTTTLQELLGTENPTEILKLINLLVTQKSNIDLSNLSSDGQAILDQKASINLNNLSAAGQAILDAKIEAEALTEQNGYIKFKLNGISKLILQWGSCYIETTKTSTTFPISFNKRCTAVFINSTYGPNEPIAINNWYFAQGNVNKNSFTSYSNMRNYVYWLAIGY